MENCEHDCSACQADCASRKSSFLEAPNKLSRIRLVIGVLSGKGGVGKSLVTAMLAVLLKRRGLKSAILDADITGPSIPRAFGLRDRAENSDAGLFPVPSKTGIPVMSMNLLLESETDPVVWRGPIIAGAVKQFWTDVVWGDVDVLFADMPPGTGDVPLTVFQSLPVDGLVVVTTPQQLVGMVVEKALRMAELMRIPVLALVQNMSYAVCPDCGRIFRPFGEGRARALAEARGIDTFAELPIEGDLARACDGGCVELFEGSWLDAVADRIERALAQKGAAPRT